MQKLVLVYLHSRGAEFRMSEQMNVGTAIKWLLFLVFASSPSLPGVSFLLKTLPILFLFWFPGTWESIQTMELVVLQGRVGASGDEEEEEEEELSSPVRRRERDRDADEEGEGDEGHPNLGSRVQPAAETLMLPCWARTSAESLPYSISPPSPISLLLD